jgi:hypothetical protein
VFRRQQPTGSRPIPPPGRRQQGHRIRTSARLGGIGDLSRRISHRWRSLAAVSGAAAVALACAGCGGTAPPAPAGREVRGPILTLVTASGIDKYGEPVNVSQYFPEAYRPGTGRRPNQWLPVRSVTAVAAAGRLAGPTPLVMTWSRLTPSGPQLLFSQHLTVTSFGLAYSTAKSAGTIPSGVYQVVASIGKVSRAFNWTVYPPGNTTMATFSRSQQPLTAGPSGAFPEPGPLSEVCTGMLQSILSMPTVTNVHISLAAYCPQRRRDSPVRGIELASMNRDDGIQLVGRMHLQPDGMLTGNFILNLCKLPQTSDLPSAPLYLTSLIYFHGGIRSFPGYFMLPAVHAEPQVTVSSSVPPGTTVHPGERIILHVIATEPSTLGPQPGIRLLRLRGSSGRIAARRFRRSVTGCDSGRLRRMMTVLYTVPAGAPKVLKLTAIASNSPYGGNVLTISFPVSG